MHIPYTELEFWNRQNAELSHRFNQYREHRGKITRILIELGSHHECGKLLILGAGSCTDLNLRLLIQCYEHIVLTDVDEKSVVAGVRRQLRANTNRLTIKGGMDYTGLIDALAQCRAGKITSSEILASLVHDPPAYIPGYKNNFAVVASCLVLSQLFVHSWRTWGVPSDIFNLRRRLIQQHVRHMLYFSKPTGQRLLLHDVPLDQHQATEHDEQLMEIENDLARVIVKSTGHVPSKHFSPWTWEIYPGKIHRVYPLMF